VEFPLPTGMPVLDFATESVNASDYRNAQIAAIRRGLGERIRSTLCCPPIDSMNGREASGSGLRLEATVAPTAVVPERGVTST
jgi:hypothetical protein